MNSKYHILLIIILAGFISTQSIAQERWTPAYDENQLNIMNKELEIWKAPDKYSGIKDILNNSDYSPDRTKLKEDATPWDQMPDSYLNLNDAIKAGCVCDFIKSNKYKSCLIRLIGDQTAYLFLYDPDQKGHYVKEEVITPPTFYSHASVNFVDIGNGRPKFILIEHVGGHGTGLYEVIHWILGWKDNAFRTVFHETVFLKNSELGEQNYFHMTYKIVKGKSPRIESKYTFDKVYVTAYPYDFHATWKDWLFWNDKTYSFYDQRIECDKIVHSSGSDMEFGFRLGIERDRLKMLKLPPLPPKMFDYKDVDNYWTEDLKPDKCEKNR